MVHMNKQDKYLILYVFTDICYACSFEYICPSLVRPLFEYAYQIWDSNLPTWKEYMYMCRSLAPHNYQDLIVYLHILSYYMKH